MRSPTSPAFSKLKLLSRRRHARRSSHKETDPHQSTSEESAPASSPTSSPQSPSTPSSPGSGYLEAASVAVESSAALERAVRTTPDPEARNGSTVAGLSEMGLVLAGLFALPTLPFYAIYYLVAQPPGFSNLWGYLMCRGTTTILAVTPVFPPIETPKRRAKSLHVFPRKGQSKRVSTTKVTIPPITHTIASPALRPAVESIPLPGYMLSPPDSPHGAVPAGPRENVILYLHGGGYIDGHPLTMPFAYRIASDTGTRIFASTYRKVLDEHSAFPAPLVDAHAAWDYVTSLGFAPSRILLMGDSAGGHLCLYLAQHLMVAAALQAQQQQRPDADPADTLPGGLALCSPWVDLTLSFPSWDNLKDFLPAKRVRMAARSALRHYSAEAARSAPLSPVFAPEGYWRPYANTPFFISYGADEGIADEAKALVAALRRDGVVVESFEEPHGLHCGPVTPWSQPSAYVGFCKGVQGVLRYMD